MLPILIVDDSREDALLVRRVLEQCKISNPILLLNSGKACVDYFEGAEPYSNRVLPCLLFLDLVMAPMSGLNVLQRLAATPSAQGSVFVMLSGQADWRMVWEGYQLGAKTFFVKPLTVRDILQTLNGIPSVEVTKTRSGYAIALSAPSETAQRRTPVSPI